MEVNSKRDIDGTADTSMTPLWVALLATGVGVAAIAHPLAPARSLRSAEPRSGDKAPAALVAELRVSPAISLEPPAPIVPRPVSAHAARAAQAPVGLVRAFTGGAQETPTALAQQPGIPAEWSKTASLAVSQPALTETIASVGIVDAEPPLANAEPAPMALASSSMPAKMAAEPTAPEPPEPALAAAVPPDAGRSALGLAPPLEEPDRPVLAMPAAELKAMMAGHASRLAIADFEEASLIERASLVAPVTPRAEGAPYSRYSRTERGIEFDIVAQVNGADAGKVPLLIADGENISVRLGDLLSVLQPAMQKDDYDALSPSSRADEYVTLNTLRAHGIAVRFDARDQLILGSP